MGWIHRWAKLASLAPSIANYFGQSPWFAPLVKWLGGIAQERRLPPFAMETFVAWFRRRKLRKASGPPVVLWADTFNNHFHPEVAKAAVEVLEREGFRVEVPSGGLCCGRPLYDFGMLDEAEQRLHEILEHLRPTLRAGTPIVVLEPSCLAVFRDELLGLFPNDEDAKRLSQQALLLSELLLQKVPNFRPPRLEGQAIVHAHCHHRSIMGFADEQRLLEQMGLKTHIPENGCCGMAGSFGFEPGEHYEVSVACGERALLPAVRMAADQTPIIADGFSCREQIAQCSNRRAVHLAQVLAAAQRGERSWPAEVRPHTTQRLGKRMVGAAATAAVVTLAVGALIWCCQQRST
jgi:Fe-S oxidoreductase